MAGDPADERTQWEADCIRWRGKVLTGPCAHWCHDWDGLPVDATTPEFECCTCYTPEEKALAHAGR